MGVQVIKQGDMCECYACLHEAVALVYSRKSKKVLKCCSQHADIVEDENNSEYSNKCHNCGCIEPVN